jgi:hypothetical protein
MTRPVALVALALASCTATSNPDRARLAPIEHTVPPAQSEAPVAAASEPAAAPAPTEPKAQPKAQSDAAAKAQKEPAAKPPVVEALTLGRIGDQPIDAREFLRKLWVDDNPEARKILEQLVFSRLATLEADRLGVRLTDAAVDADYAKAIALFEKKLVERGSTLTLDEHIDRNLEVDPKLYRANLRHETIVQMLAERCVRSWMLESDRRKVRRWRRRRRSSTRASRSTRSRWPTASARTKPNAPPR